MTTRPHLRRRYRSTRALTVAAATAAASLVPLAAHAQSAGPAHPALCQCPLCRGLHPQPTAAVVASADAAQVAGAHPSGVPQLASRPGAAYTLYLDFAGFNFTGSWGNAGSGAPGTIPAFNGAVDAFSPSDQAQIAQVWAATAEKYAGFNVNVTTVDPAVVAGKTTDAQRQNYYDATTRMMHTVIGNTSFTAAGVSYLGVIQGDGNPSGNNGAGAGYHTNFVVPAGTGFNGIAEAAAHENGHAFGLQHQSDYGPSGTKVQEYSTNPATISDTGVGSSASGNNTVSPIMGASYYAQRGVWRVGKSAASSTSVQNDVAVIAGNSGNSLVEDGVGHSAATAALLPTSGTAVNPVAARGVIVPVTAAAAANVGAANYKADYFAFNTAGGAVSLVLHDAGSRITPGTADPKSTLAANLSIVDANDNVLYTAAESFSTQTATISQTLSAGTYYLKVTSGGGRLGTADPTATYTDMGDYYLTGTGVSGRSVGTYYWQGGASTAKWSQVDGATSNWLSEHTAGTDRAAAPSATDNVFLSVDSGATNLTTMSLGGSRTVNSLTFTGTGTTAATTGVAILADGSTLTLTAADGHVDQSLAGVSTGVGLVVQPGAAANSIAANVALGSGQTWQINNAATSPLTVSGTVSGTTLAAGLTVTGGGKLALTAANTYAGGTYVNASTIAFAPGALGAGQVTIAGGGAIQFGPRNTEDLTANGRVVAVGGGGGQVDTNGNNVTLANGVNDAFAGYLTKTGAGTLSVGGASNPTNLFVRAGGLTLLSGATVSTANGGTGNQFASVGQITGDTAATLTVNGGATLTVAGDFNAGDQTGTGGTVAVLPGGTINARTLYVAKSGNSTGAVVQTGGTVQEADNGAGAVDWRIGGGTGTGDQAAVGTYAIAGGTLNSGPSNLQVGTYGTGTLTQTGGTVTTNAYLSIARYPGSVGTVDLSAGNGVLTANTVNLMAVGEQGTGTLKVGGASVVNTNTLSVGLSNGLAATGTVLQTGGTVNAATGVSFGTAATGTTAVSATYTLGGGTLNTSGVTQGTAAGITGTFHFAGGTLAPTATNFAFMQGLTRADVGLGGARVDTAAFAVNVAQPLLHDATGPAVDGGLTKLGTGVLRLAAIESYTGPTNASAGTLAFAANAAGGGYRRQALPGGLSVAAGAIVQLLPAATKVDRTLLAPTGLAVAGRLDVANNDLAVAGSSVSAVSALAASGFAGGTWNGSAGLISTVAAADADHLSAVGVIPNTANGTTPLYPVFDGRSSAASDVLVRFTLYGDANLDGVVTAADFGRLDVGAVTALTGWFNGDFNYDGSVDGSDYALADNAFNRQSNTVAAPASAVAATAAAQVAAVPEPASAVALSLAMAATLGRRRRR